MCPFNKKYILALQMLNSPPLIANEGEKKKDL
jgi:hypothetical protein